MNLGDPNLDEDTESFMHICDRSLEINLFQTAQRTEAITLFFPKDAAIILTASSPIFV